uniref:Peptidase S74 domain-containing protein n=1 Tax=Zooxanthella nutricula TaxID=1333877 RepID=A0A7S2K9E0_9DINO
MCPEQGHVQKRDELVAEAPNTRQHRRFLAVVAISLCCSAFTLFRDHKITLQISLLQQEVEKLKQHNFNLRQLTQTAPWKYTTGSNVVRLQEGVGLRVKGDLVVDGGSIRLGGQGDIVVDDGNILLEGKCGPNRTGKGNLIIGDANHYTSAQNSLIVGKKSTVIGCGSIAGGTGHTVNASFAAAIGGSKNKASGITAAVVGGQNNEATGDYSVVVGGSQNTAENRQGSSVFGGRQNVASGLLAAVFGGRQNRATDKWAVVAGGFNNSATFKLTAIFGGARNIVEGDDSWFAVCVGGDTNTAPVFGATVVGSSGSSCDTTYCVTTG